MTDASEWRGRVGESWAAEWRRTDRSFGALTEHLLARSRDFSFNSVLDVGCGAGELSLALARGRPHIQVTGIDISPSLVAVASERGLHLSNIAFEVADAAEWQPATPVQPNLLVSRHGVMFFDRPASTFGHLAGLAAAGAGLLFSCFREPAENPVFTEVSRLIPNSGPAEDPTAPGPFAFADVQRVEQILAAGGWTGAQFEPFDFGMIVGAGEDPVEDAVGYFSAIGPAARAARDMSADQRKRFFDRVRELARRNLHEGIVSLRAATWIVTARKS